MKALLHRLGFAELATDQAPSQIQFNALFVRRDLSARMQFQVNAWLVHARLRYLIVAVIRRMYRMCVRRSRSSLGAFFRADKHILAKTAVQNGIEEPGDRDADPVIQPQRLQ